MVAHALSNSTFICQYGTQCHFICYTAIGQVHEHEKFLYPNHIDSWLQNWVNRRRICFVQNRLHNIEIIWQIKVWHTLDNFSITCIRNSQEGSNLMTQYIDDSNKNNNNGKGKFVPVLFFNWASRHGGVRGSRGIAPSILVLGTRWRWVISFTPPSLYPQWKSPYHPLDRNLSAPQNRSGCGGEGKNFLPLPGLDPPIIQWIIKHELTESTRVIDTHKLKFVCS